MAWGEEDVFWGVFLMLVLTAFLEEKFSVFSPLELVVVESQPWDLSEDKPLKFNLIVLSS